MADMVGIGFAAASRLPKKVAVITRGRGDFHSRPYEETLHADDVREIKRVTQPLEPLEPNHPSARYSKNFNDERRLAHDALSADFVPHREPRVVAAPAAAAAGAAMLFRRAFPKKPTADQKRRSIKKEEESIVVTVENPKSVQQQQKTWKSFPSRGGVFRGW